MRGRRRPAWGRIVAVSLSGVALFALWRYTPLADYLTAERLAGWARAVRGTWRVNGSALGMAPSLFIWTLFGRQAAAWLEDPSSMSWRIVAAAVVLLALFTLLVRRWFAKQEAQAA